VDTSVGSTVAHYRLERPLGTGGMGAVFLARDTRLGRMVALKLLVAPTAPEARRRLLREARASAALDHPGICAIYDVGHDDRAGDYIAMQFVEGETLAARLQRGRLRPDDALVLVAQIAEALGAAHRQGIVHRDLKPGNLIITPSGAPKILDFGLATHVPGTPSAAEADTATHVTDPGVVVGTPAYMSPEQVRNEPLDFRTDVFSLGCVLYECLTGRRAFHGSTSAEVMGEVLHVEPPPASHVVPELGETYDGLCGRMLHKRPAERFQSAEEVLGALRALTPSIPAPSRSATGQASVARRPFPRRAAIVATAGVTLAVAAIVWSMRDSLPDPPDEARRWYERGIDAMRDGTYAGARVALSEAVRLFPAYPQAHARLAEAYAAIDDERNAQKALLELSQLVPNQSRLPREDQLRFEAARAFTLRRFDEAIGAYTELAQDAGGWIDVGRVQEAAGRRADARASYEKAVSLDRQLAAGYLRLGILQGNTDQTSVALATLDEAIRLYRLASRPEGEAQAILSKGVALSSRGQFADARPHFDRVLAFASGGTEYAAQAVAAEIQLSRVEFFSGSFATAEEYARRAVARATDAGLQTLAAAGVLALGNTLLGARQYDAADAQYARAIELAAAREARRVEHRARLQQASLRLQTSRPDQALALSEGPMKYFEQSNDARLFVEAQLVAARAHVALDQPEEASRLTENALAFAEKRGDEGLIAAALENRAGQLASGGMLPDALALRERLERLNRTLGNGFALPFDLANRAELLIQLGRGAEAVPLLDEIAKGIADGVQAFAVMRTRLQRMRALAASVERRFADVVAASVPPADLMGRILTEHALAHLGRSRRPPAEITGWIDEASAASRPDVSFWVASTLRARRDAPGALAVALATLASPAARRNPEASWRVAALAAAVAGRQHVKSATIAAQFRATEDRLLTAWAGAASAYFARPDLAELRKGVR
jgi:tetratricopeptide (TPR) repeat protein